MVRILGSHPSDPGSSPGNGSSRVKKRLLPFAYSAVFALFKHAVARAAGVETNECLENNGGCWENKNANITACKVRNSLLHTSSHAHCFRYWCRHREAHRNDHQRIPGNLRSFFLLQDTFRGRVCQCPLVDGVQFQGDGYTTCEGILYSVPSSVGSPACIILSFIYNHFHSFCPRYSK